MKQVFGALAFLAACNGSPLRAARPPLHAEVRNFSMSCKTQEWDALNHQSLTCDLAGELALTGDAANERPYIAIMRRIVNGKEQPSLENVGVIDGRGPFESWYSEDRPLGDKKPPPKIEYRVLGLWPLEPVK